ncbi:hypothetical protein AAE02nite_36710 [Adhaeribacter aerolatus]|uniref:Fibronectin type-III domain-containing protein n=2 Tax=Adhaeribacter aerolatus TaxID=670289 RepID=A0A512B2K5_9BACT|nr:hypothetical protein AAE02nite_36710 [Adhaeribacter aerolatus]
MVSVLAAPAQITYHIKVDQFGYFPISNKVAVIADPQQGFNATEEFTAGTGINQYEVRRWDNDEVVFSGTLMVWNNGSTHIQSGDKGWWFDFSAVTTPGSYYIYDTANNVGSFRFEIAETVYQEVLKHAVRTFYYQRLNFAKETPYTDAEWADAASYEGLNQDRYATSRFAKGDMSTVKDLHGGWMDAGDVNKYTTFATSAIIQLMEAYRINPSVFKDNYNIPESGNGIPDLLDEAKWELDFLKRMQNATGTNGFLLKVGVDNYNEVTPLSKDTRPRYYLPECTSATIAGCSMFAVSGVALKNVPALADYGLDLITRAERAWARAKITTSNFSYWQTNCDDGDIKSGDADNTAEQQLENAFVAAVYLYEATGKDEYRNFAELNYTKVRPYKEYWWGPYRMPQHLALLRLTTLPGVSSTVITNIRNQKANMDNLSSITDYISGKDLYRSHMNDEAYHWGHNQARADAGNINLDYITFNINNSRHAQYKEVAEQYIHWMHGVNPMGMVMLSNMYNYGAEKCVNEIFHTWFTNGSDWDNALISPKGPAPGYVPGGPNKSYSDLESEISMAPHQKAYKDWNTNWPDKSWEITENAIYYQAAYVSMLARLMPPDTNLPEDADTEAPSAPSNLIATNISENSIALSWTASTDNVGVAGYDIYNGTNLLQANLTNITYNVTGLSCATNYEFTVKAKDAAGNYSSVSNTASTKSCMVLVANMIYADMIGADWQDVSQACIPNYSNTNPVKTGSSSIKVNYSGNGKLIIGKRNEVITTANTQLQFWTYNTDKNGIKIYTETASGLQSQVLSLKPTKGRWVEVKISISQLGDPASIQKIIIQNNATIAATMYFDEVRLTNVNVITSNSTGGVLEMMVNGKTDESKIATGEAAMNINVYPNPIKEQANFYFQTEKSANATIQLMDYTGRIVLQKEMWVSPGMAHFKLDTAKLAPGPYLIRMIIGKTNFAKKIIKE